MMTRRRMLQTTAVMGVLGFAASLPGLRAAAQATPPLRRSLKGMDLDDPVLVTLREFVTMMKDPARDGQNVSWIGFSDIHGSFAVGFNKCPHGNWYFLPWHRSYVRMYEVAARALTGDTEFAMPYWDWTEQPDFPAAFGDETFDGQPNPLFVADRSMQTGDEMDPSVTGQAVMDSIYANQSFEEFGSSRATGQDSLDAMWISARGTSGELEFNPHNNVHCDVRGPFMCSGASPQDPIFQMHHCNIDRIWAEWIARGGADSTDPLWLDMPFTDNFFDPDGNAYTDVVNQLLEVEPLGYTYGLGEPDQPPAYYPGRTMYLAALYGAPFGAERLGLPGNLRTVEQVAAPDAPLSVQLTSERVQLSAALDPSLAAALRNTGLGAPSVYAFVRQLAPANVDGTQVRVFVNLPEANAETETEGNPHYVTSIGFFGPTGIEGEHDMRSNVALDLSPSLRRLMREGAEVGDEVTLQLVPVAQQPGDEPGEVTIGEIELAVV